MSTITLDFETYYDSAAGYTLSKLTTEEYIRDRRYETVGVSVKVDDAPAQYFTGTEEEIANVLNWFNLEKHAVVAHNAMFDDAILSWRFGIRPKLKVMNKKLQRLTKAVKYTSMADIWAEIEEGSHDKADKKTIVKDCMNRWKRNGKIK